jgi:hypothetical protein
MKFNLFERLDCSKKGFVFRKNVEFCENCG